MKEEKKLHLDEIKVKSFTTTLTMLDSEKQKAVKGGSKEGGEVGTTSLPIFC